MPNISYYVQSAYSERFFWADDVGVPSADQPKAEDVVVHLPKISDSLAGPIGKMVFVAVGFMRRPQFHSCPC